ncbi:MAG: hypothetical protein QME51_02245 [Planctomycetota bacterium]|nr:hypothetical protein [Planctomycetota bacterium]MDI6787174.1 hypothetical protein [Planctomycetota bacterium]
MKRLLLALLCLLLCLVYASAQEEKIPPPPSPQEGEVSSEVSIEEILKKTFSANLREVSVRELLKSIAKIGPLNIVTTKSVAGQLTFLMENVTLGDALEIVLITNGLAKEIKGNILHIMTEAEYQALYGSPYNTRLVAKTYELKYTLPKRIATFLENIKSRNTNSQILPDDGTRTLLIIEVKDKILQMEELIKRLDVPAETQTFELKNADVETIVPEITKLITPLYGEIKTDKRMKRIMVTDNPYVLENVAFLIHQFDAKPRQVLIEAKMIQISLSDEFSMGIKWTQVFSHYSAFKDVKLVGDFPIRGDLAKKVNLSATIGTIPKTHYELVMQAMKAFGDNKLISAPRLSTLSDKEATFMVGTKEAYATTSRTTATGTTTETETVQFLDVGVKLSVTPSINEEKYITMLIKPEISAVTRWETTSLGNRIPILETANTSTNVMVRDGVSIVIAGLIKDEKKNESTGIPFLSQIPLIGPLFGSRREYVIKTETVIFLTPYILTGDIDSSVISRQYDLERKEPKELKPIR